jgi:molybdopterin molybdotransferase
LIAHRITVTILSSAFIQAGISPLTFSIDRGNRFGIASIHGKQILVKTMIRVEEARERILGSVRPLGLEKVFLLDALGQVIGEVIHAGRAIPPWDNSAMDGYALRAEDTGGAAAAHPVWLEVVEEIAAGNVPAKRIGPGQAARIMTGAPLPQGADAVIRMEDCRKEEERVAILAEAVKGRQIRRTGDEVRMGDEVISRGDVIRPAEIGMLASLGISFVFVHRRPLVAVVATGNELTEIDEEPPRGKIVGSNSYSLAAMVQDCGAIPLRIGIAKDRREDLIDTFKAAMQADLIVSAGGVSVGDFDLVKGIMQAEGNRLFFWRIAMKPGKPLAFGALGKVPIIGLPGNPVSAMVCFEQFVRPAILRMLGHKNLFRRTLRARLTEGIEKKKGFLHFIRAWIRQDQDGYVVTTKEGPGFGMIQSMVGANGLILIPEETEAVRAGEMVAVQLLDDSLDRSPEPGY